MCTVIDLFRALIEEERILIKIEFNRATIMFELLCALIELNSIKVQNKYLSCR